MNITQYSADELEEISLEDLTILIEESESHDIAKKVKQISEKPEGRVPLLQLIITILLQEREA